MTVQFYLGIDPGLDGAIAALAAVGSGAIQLLPDECWVADTPTLQGAKRRLYDEAGMVALLRRVSGEHTSVAIELSQAMVRADNGRAQGSVSTHATGTGWGLWRGMLAALGLSYTIVAPRTWRSSLGVPVGGSKADVGVAVARLHPQLAGELKGPRGGYLDGRADALGLAEYARRTM